MTDDPDDPLRGHPDATPEMRAFLQALASPETFTPLDDQRPTGYLDGTVWTVFLRQTIARAVTERGRKRVEALRKMEQLIARQEAGFRIGMEGHLLGSIARAYPVSHSLMRRELRGLKTVNLIELAEQIELGHWVAPYRGSVPRPPGRPPPDT